jgi:hypothetical protein
MQLPPILPVFPVPDRAAAHNIGRSGIDDQPHRHSTPSDRFDNVHRASAIQDLDTIETAVTQTAANLPRTQFTVAPTTPVVPSATVAARSPAMIDLDDTLGVYRLKRPVNLKRRSRSDGSEA